MRRLFAFAAVLAPLVLAPPARAAAPEWTGSLGGTLAIDLLPNSGGLSGSIAALWPLEESFALGAAFFADDLGLVQTRLVDPHSGELLGVIDNRHRAVYAGAWRLDARLPVGRDWMPFASGTWGYYRINDDLHGTLLSRIGSTGFSLAGGVRRVLGSGELGASLRYHRMFNNRIGRYVSAGLDWSWRSGR